MKIRKNGKVINLTESDLRRIVKKVINEGVTATPNIENPNYMTISVNDGNGKLLYKGLAGDASIKSRFDANEVMTITIPGLVCESAMINATVDGKNAKLPVECKGDKIMINVSKFGTEKLQNETITIKGNVEGGTAKLVLNMVGSSVKQA